MEFVLTSVNGSVSRLRAQAGLPVPLAENELARVSGSALGAERAASARP